MKHIKSYKKFESLDPMGSWNSSESEQDDKLQFEKKNKLGIDDIQPGDKFIDDDFETVTCVELIKDPTNFSPIATIVGDNKMCYGFTMMGWSSIRRKL